MQAISRAIRVLHIDDEPGFADTAAAFIEREDDRLSVATATSTEEGLAYLSEHAVDCVVSDYDMPGRNGIELLQAVREEYPDLPFILFTGKGSEEVASDAISAGVTDYLQKEGGTDQYTVLTNRVRNAVERTRAQRERRRQLDAIETAQEGISILDEDGHFIYVNRAYTDLYGYDPGTMIGEHWNLIYREEDVDEIRDEILPHVEATGHWHGTTTGVRADGSTFLEDHVIATTDRGELVCTVRDITEHREREQRIEALHGASRRLMAADTREEIAQTTAEAARETLHYPSNVVRLREADDRLVPVTVTKSMTMEIGGQRPTYEIGEQTAGLPVERGETVVYDDVSELDDDVDRGNARATMYVPIGTRGVITISDTEPDVLDRSDVELAEVLAANAEAALDRVEQAEELKRQNEQLTRFASTVAHDLKNPLSVASGNVELAAEECDSDRLSVAMEALERMSEMVDGALTLARSGETIGDTRPVDLAALARQSWSNVDSATAELRVADPPTVDADSDWTGHLLENLFGNAVGHADAPVTVRIGSLSDGFYVEDDGPGIPPAERDHVFDAGYSTSNEGTGLGLSIVKRIADAHGWTIDVTESADDGSRFEFTGVEMGV